jgi:hypothetical protein
MFGNLERVVNLMGTRSVIFISRTNIYIFRR